MVLYAFDAGRYANNPQPGPDPPAPEPTPAVEDPDGHAGLWAAFIAATAVLAVVTYLLRRD